MADAEPFAVVALAALSLLIAGGCVAWLVTHPTADCPACGHANEAADPHCRLCGCPLKESP